MSFENLYGPQKENGFSLQDLHAFEPTLLTQEAIVQKKNDFDLVEELFPNKSTIFYMRVNSDVMKEAGIFKNDIVVVDRSLKPASGKVVIAMLGGDILIRRLEKNNKKIRLLADSQKLAPINIDANCEDFTIWGVVTYVIHKP